MNKYTSYQTMDLVTKPYGHHCKYILVEEASKLVMFRISKRALQPFLLPWLATHDYNL